MIQTNCPTCNQRLQVNENQMGTQVQCGNCGGQFTVPGTAGASQPQGQTIVVQLQGAQPTGGMIGPKRVNLFGLILCHIILPGSQYLNMGQYGKGALFSIISVFMWIFVMMTCGIGLIFAAPYGLFIFIDSLVVRSRLANQPISAWRFF